MPLCSVSQKETLCFYTTSRNVKLGIAAGVIGILRDLRIHLAKYKAALIAQV